MSSERKVCDLGAALARMGGNQALLRQMAEFLYADAPVLISRLKAAVERGSPPESHRLAHSLKGLIVNFDGQIAAECALEIEQLARAEKLREASGKLPALETALGELIAELRTQLAPTEQPVEEQKPS